MSETRQVSLLLTMVNLTATSAGVASKVCVSSMTPVWVSPTVTAPLVIVGTLTCAYTIVRELNVVCHWSA